MGSGSIPGWTLPLLRITLTERTISNRATL